MTDHFPEAPGTEASGAIPGRPLSSCLQGNLLVDLAPLKYLGGMFFFQRRKEQKVKCVISRYCTLTGVTLIHPADDCPAACDSCLELAFAPLLPPPRSAAQVCVAESSLSP